MSLPDRDQIIAALDAISDPKTGRGLNAAGVVQGLIVGEGRAGFMMEVAAEDAALYAPVRAAAEAALKGVAGVERAQVVLTAAARSRKAAAAPAPPARRTGVHVPDDPRINPPNMPPPERVPHVKRIIAVASGKGGVGKSTVSVNLALAFQSMGLRTGLLDVDIYGPSIPKMLGSSDRPVMEDGLFSPIVAQGLKLMSIGFIVPESRATPWRGPMATQAVKQMLWQVRWGTEAEPLDVLVVDLPPGTGDIHLTLVQSLAMDGVVIVSTPQEIALIDARKASAMFRGMPRPVRILGVVENMAYFPDPTTGKPIEIFGRGGAKEEAGRLGVPFLGEIPIDIALRQGGDDGRPLVAAAPESPVAKVFLDMARRLAG